MRYVTFESVEAFVNRCLKCAKSMPDCVNRFEAQAFGAVVFACESIWRNEPKLEKSLMMYWESEWRPMFESLY